MTNPLPSLARFARGLVAPKKPEPSYPTLPQVDERGESSIPGVYLIGDIAGTPLLKKGLNAGHDLVEHLAGELEGEPRAAGASKGRNGVSKNLDAPDPLYDLVIVGSGPAGLGAALRAHERGLRYVVLEGERLANNIATFTRGKVLFAEPLEEPLRSGFWLEECTKEELVERWTVFVAERGLNVRTFEKVTDLRREGAALRVESDRARYRARRVILAIGKAGNPRKLGVPGEREFADKIDHRLSDPRAFTGKHILVVGAGDVAAECALALCGDNRVTLSAIDEALTFPKKRNVDALRAAEAAGRLRIELAARVREIRAREVVIERAGETLTLANDHVFECIGAELPVSFFKKIGIRLEGTWEWRRVAALVACFAAVYLLYAWKKAFPLDPATGEYEPAQALWPFGWIYPHLGRATVVNVVRPLGLDPSFWYSALYTVVMLVFGALAMRRWRSRYQYARYASLIAFQVVFFLIVNLAAPRLVGDAHAWRAWGLYQPFPLFFNTFYWFGPDDAKWIAGFFIGFGVFLVFGFMPWMARRHGKRFCTWICGCGGLAETLGDRWRHKSPKGERSRAWEFQGAVILAWSVAAVAMTFTVYDGNAWNWVNRAYMSIVDFWLVAVIPIALYPFFGGKVWCRYWCPLAAYNQLLSKWFGRLRIESNDKCISCTQCSKYCQVGVDVMAFAKAQEPFDNRNSSCIHCGICIDVCPMDVLRFSTADTRPVTLELPADAAAEVRSAA